MIQIKSEKIDNYQVNIALPSGYHVENNYRTIYMHDGGNGATQVMNYIDHLIISKQIEPVIIVGIIPNNRNDDYTPWEAPSLLPNVPTLGGQAKNYLDTLVNKIKPFIDANYATNPASSHTTISGCSFGGLVSIFASYYYPEVFHHYIILSASFWYDGVLQYMQGEEIIRNGTSYKKPVINRENHHMYLYVGEIEGIYRDTVQKHMVSDTKKACEELMKEGFQPENILFEQHPEGTHDAYFFSMHFLRALQWLYGIKQNA